MSAERGYEIDPDGRLAGLGVGIFGVLAVFAAFGGIRGAPGAFVLLGVCAVAVVICARVLTRRGIVLDRDGITDRRTGEHVPWREVATLELVERPHGGDTRSFLEVIRSDGRRAEIAVWNLEASPERILERAAEVRARAG